MQSAWAADIEKFTPQLSYSLAYAEQRAEAFALKTDVVIINIDGVKWLLDNPKVLKGFDHLVIDEITGYKHASSQRSKAMAKIRKAFKRRYGMTGTPNPNSVTELWHQMLIIDNGVRLGMNFHRFRAAVQTPTQIGPSSNHLKWEDRPGVELAVHKMVEDITIRHLFEEVMTHVPANHRDTKMFELSKKALAAYSRMENEALLVLQDATISAPHAMTVRNKLLQIASGAVYNGNEDSAYSVIDTKRYALIADLVEEREHSVVFFNWRHQRELLEKEFKARKITYAFIDGSVPQRKRDEIVVAYQAGHYQTLLLHPRTGAHGLTLTRGTTTILSSPIYEADLLKQAIHRIYRGAQDKVTNTIMVCAERTVEELVYERLFSKEERMNNLLEMLTLRRA